MSTAVQPSKHDGLPKVAIFGAGSIGCYLGGQLASAGVPVRFIGRERFQTALNEHGLTLTHYERSSISVSADKFLFDVTPNNLVDADVILVTVKSQDTALAGQTIAQHAHPDALVVSIQNGIRNADLLRAELPAATVLGGMVPFNVTGTGAGQFHCGTEGDLHVEYCDDARLVSIQRSFQEAGQGCQLDSDIASVLWGKLLVNLNNAMNTLYGGTLKAGLMQRDYRLALATMIQEALGVVRQTGIEPAKFGKATPEKMIRVLKLPNFLYGLIMNTVVKIDATARSSMQDDLQAGRPPEVDFLQGEIVRLAEATGQTAPVNQCVLDLTHAAFKAGRSPGLSGKALLAAVKQAAKS
ncbi:MAG: 2-dehydropantoate 2-reductase [Woeseiaceae bacterium]